MHQLSYHITFCRHAISFAYMYYNMNVINKLKKYIQSCSI